MAKLGIVVEEADETLFWCELLEEAGIVPAEIKDIMKEAREILAIFSTARKTAKTRQVS
ncbi:four helix bundle protein [Nitrospira sp. Nam80]